MKKLVITLAAVVLLLILATSASAHGTPDIVNSDSGVRVSGGMVFGRSSYRISETHCFLVATATLYRRIPGQAWAQVAYKSNPKSVCSQTVTANTAQITFNCNKDYYVRAFGYVDAYNNHGQRTELFYRYHTC